MKLKCFVVIISFLLILTGCGVKADSQEKQANLILDELIVALENEDASAIKEMFAEDVQNSIDLDTQIEEMLEYFDGKVISYEKIGTVAGGESYDDGVLTYSRVGNALSNKVTTGVSTYSISFSAILVDEKNKSREGMWRIWIGKNDDDYLIIGEREGC